MEREACRAVGQVHCKFADIENYLQESNDIRKAGVPGTGLKPME